MLVKFQAFRARNVRGTRIKEGQPMWAVQKGGLYFIWAYSCEDFAKQMDAKLSGPKDSTDRAANWRTSLDDLVGSDRTSF